MGSARSKGFDTLVHYASMEPWKLEVAPFRVAPNVYYVGNAWVGVYLIDGNGDGRQLAVIDTAVFETMYLTLESIRRLGFDPQNIKNIFVSHMHFDHTGGVTQLKNLTGAKVWMSKIDAELRDSFANLKITKGENPFKFPPFDVDAYYDVNCDNMYGTAIQVGKVSVQPVLTVGHTPGAVSFVLTMPDESGSPVVAAMHGGVGPMTMSDAAYAELGVGNLRPKFMADCGELSKLHVDIAIPSHPSHGELFERATKGAANEYRHLIDTSAWADFLAERKKFVEDVDIAEKERAAAISG